IREPPVGTQSKIKEKVDVARGKGINLLSEVALTKEDQMKEITPPVTSEGTGDKPGVLDVNKDELTENSEQDTNGSESDSKSDQQDDDDEVKGEDDDNDDDKYEVFRFNDRVITLEKDVVEQKNDPLHTQVTSLVDDHLETRMGATREEFMNFLSASLTDRITEQFRNQLPQILPEEVSNFALLVIEKMIQEFLN
nr:hypothetical protein [Tanacetum cinerariifolium]